MKRSDFLAFIPSIAAIPLLGKNIVKTDGGIFIEKPVPLVTNIPDSFNPMNLQVRLFYEGEDVGSAVIDNFTINAPLNSYMETKIECRVLGLFGMNTTRFIER